MNGLALITDMEYIKVGNKGFTPQGVKLLLTRGLSPCARGNITVKYVGNNSFQIKPDKYNFDIHTDNFFQWKTILRNLETIGASILHGSGTPFNIKFKGLYHNK